MTKSRQNFHSAYGVGGWGCREGVAAAYHNLGETVLSEMVFMGQR
jgi:hypothetical protein